MIYRALLLSILVLAISHEAFSQREFKTKGDTVYTMKRYVFMLLNEGPKRDQDSATAAKIQEGHMKHLNEMAATKKNGDCRSV